MWARRSLKLAQDIRHGQKRFLNTQNSRQINLGVKVVGKVLQTSLDRKEKETYKQYKKRGIEELAAQIPKELHGRDLLMFKLNMSAIDPEARGQHIEPFEIGHVATAIVRVDGLGIDFEKDTVISKTQRSGFEEQDDYVSEKFISKDYPPADYPIKEYYLFIDPNEFNSSLADIYRELSWRLKFENRRYELFSDACGHAVYEALTGEKLPPRVSAQTALQKTVAKISSENPELLDTMNKVMRDLGMNKRGDQVGRDYLDYRSSRNLARPSFGQSPVKE